MATLLITHLGAGSDDPNDAEGAIRLNEFSVDLLFGTPRTIENVPANVLPQLVSLARNQAAAKISVAVTYSADEVASGLHLQPNSVEARDIAPEAAATFLSAGMLLRVPMVDGGTTNADDIVIVAAGGLVNRLRCLDIWAEITTNQAGETVELNDQAAAAGNNIGDVDANAAALRVGPNTVYGGVTDAPGALIGLFAHRTHDGIEGTLYALLRPES